MVERFQMKTEHDWICARPDLEGDWVRHSDYEALRIELEQVKRERDEARSDHEWMRDNRNKWQDATTRERNRAEATERLAGARVKPVDWRNGCESTPIGDYLVAEEDWDDEPFWFIIFNGKPLNKLGEH